MAEAREKGLKAYLIQNKLKIGENIYTVEVINKKKINEQPATKHDELTRSHTEEISDDESYSTPKLATKFQTQNSTVSNTGAIPKRKNISPLQSEQDEILTKQVQKLRDVGFTKKHRQLNIRQYTSQERSVQNP